VVPVDGMSGNGQVAFDEQAVAYILTSAPIRISEDNAHAQT
jgi:hypothetical protein